MGNRKQPYTTLIIKGKKRQVAFQSGYEVLLLKIFFGEKRGMENTIPFSDSKKEEKRG